MIKKLLTSLAVLCALTQAQVPVTPIIQPHMTFVDAAGQPCAGCKLYTYTAGTTTPFPTYVDSTGTSQNFNPIVLDASGGPATPSGSTGGIWLGKRSYKFILKDALGNTIWTADNVNASTLFPCGPANTVQISNTAINGFTCDSIITIDPINHTLNVGTISASRVTIGPLGTPTSWTFDTTTPATALASLGGSSPVAPGTLNQLAFYAAAGSTVSGTSAIPSAITATTQAPSDNTTKLATTAYVALPGAIAPSSLAVAGGTAMIANQGAGALVQHSTGTTTSGHAAVFDATGNVVDSGSSGTPFATLTDQTGSRTLATSFHNTGSGPMYVTGYGLISSGSGDSTITCNVGSSSPSIAVWSTITTGTISSEHVGFSCMVPPGYFYSITATNLITSIGKWVEEN